MLQTAQEVINKLGGIKKVAEFTERKVTAVAQWRYRKFPCSTYELFRKELSKIGETANPKLWGMDE